MPLKSGLRAFGVILAICCYFAPSFCEDTEFNLELSTLSSSSEVSLLTIEFGTGILSAFGHCSIRIKDPQLGIDAVYHYGISAPSAIKFILGSIEENRFGMLMRSSTEGYLENYTESKRQISESILNLELSEKNLLFERLLNDYFGQNRRYNYRPFQTNCATQLFDFLFTVVDCQIDFEEPIDKATNESYFEIIQPYLENRPWVALALNLTFGTDAHRAITYRETAFIPDRLESLLSESSIVRAGQSKSTIESIHYLFEREDQNARKLVINPFILLFAGLLLTIYITIREVVSKMRNARFDFILFGLISIASLGLIYISANIMHSYSSFNYNLAWIMPLHIVPLLNFIPNRARRIYFRIWTGLFIGVFFAYWLYLYPLFKQLWPLILVFTIRSCCITGL